MNDEKPPDQSLVKSDRSDQLHEQHDIDSLSRVMLQQKEEYDRSLLEEKLFSNKLRNWLSRFSRFKQDYKAMEEGLMREAAELLGNVPQPPAGDEPVEGEIVDPPPDEAA